MRILITGGGTGGHVSPAVAVIAALRDRSAADGFPLELLYLGSDQGIERRLIAEIGVRFVSVQTGKLRRYLSWRTPLDLARIPIGVVQSAWQVARFRPSVIFSTGGYVCVPPVIAGWLLRVPSITHEQTARSGLANRIAGRFSRIVAVSFPQSAAAFPPGRTLLTGNPLRPGLADGDPARAAADWRLDPSLPTVYVTGGVLGAHVVNETLRDSLPRLLEVTQIVHQVGEGPNGSRADLTAAEKAGRADPQALARYRPVAFVGPELADLYALARLVVGRAGAGTVNELAALGKPAVLIPLPGTASDEQTANARTLSDAGGAVLLPQSECTPDRLASTILDLLSDPARLAQMSTAGHGLDHPHAAEEIVNLLLTLGRSKLTADG
ncbi:MAG: undecaprenyldiphospho-muramoylpentapeptide beta-N-acetylglucosaminyltransferase [Chloroflexia bacterium]